MTAALVDRTTARRPSASGARRPDRPQLRVLDQEAARRRARYRNALLVLFISVLLGFFAVAFVHAELVAGQQELDAIRAEISRAEGHHAELARAVEEASAPDVIVERATDLGMVRAETPVYLSAAAPVRPVEVAATLVSPIASEGPEEGERTGGDDVVAAPADASSQGTTTGSNRALRGSLGTAGGISAAIRLPTTPSSTAGPDLDGGLDGDVTAAASTSGPTGASTASASLAPATGRAPDASAVEVGPGSAAGAVTSTASPSPGNPPVTTAPAQTTSSIGGARAVSSAAGATASTSPSGMAMAAAATGAG